MSTFAYHRDLISHLVRRDLTLRYHGSVIGILWSLAIPVAQLVVLVFLFQKVIPLGIEFYPGFLFSALLPWVWFTSCLGSTFRKDATSCTVTIPGVCTFAGGASPHTDSPGLLRPDWPAADAGGSAGF